MKVILSIYGEDKRIYLEPENEADKKILEIVAECEPSEMTVGRKYNYSDREIERITFKLKAK